MVFEYRVNWLGASGGPGVTVFHGRPPSGTTDEQVGEAMAGRARAFFDAVRFTIPEDYVLSFPGEAIELNTTTGILEDVYTFTAPADVLGGGEGEFARPAGARIEWRTPAIVAGRRLRGRTFIVPMIGGAFDVDGTLDTTVIATLQAAADDYLDAGVFADSQPVVWSRTHGILADITSALIPDEATILRSRRD